MNSYCRFSRPRFHNFVPEKEKKAVITLMILGDCLWRI